MRQWSLVAQSSSDERARENARYRRKISRLVKHMAEHEGRKNEDEKWRSWGK